MKEIIQEVLQKINWNSTLKSVADKGVEKVVASAVGATIYDLGTIFCLLLLLEIIDIYTACVYQSSVLWKKMYDPHIVERHGNLLNYTKWIWEAHHWRFVDSSVLKDGFLSKTIVYFVLICTGQAIDTILAIRHAPQVALTLFCGVMACTEGLSICENLDSAGIKIGGELRELLQKKKEGMK